MTVHRLVDTLANRPREVHVLLYGMVAAIVAPKVVEEISEEPQYLVLGLLVALGYKHYQGR